MKPEHRAQDSKSARKSADDGSSTIDPPKYLSISARKRDEIHIQEPLWARCDAF